MDPNSEGWKALKQFSSRTELLRTTAVEGTVHLRKIKFSAEGHNYLLLMSMPITVSDHAWVKQKPEFKPSERMVRASDAR